MAVEGEDTPDEGLLTEAVVARMLGVAPRTLQHWRMNAQNLPFVTIGPFRRYRRSDVEAFLEANTVRPLTMSGR